LGQNPYKASDGGVLQSCKIDRSFGAIARGRRRRVDAFASLRKGIPDVRFADRIEVVTRDARAAAAWPRPSPAIDAGTTVNDGMFLNRNSAPRKRLKINALRFAQK